MSFPIECGRKPQSRLGGRSPPDRAVNRRSGSGERLGCTYAGTAASIPIGEAVTVTMGLGDMGPSADRVVRMVLAGDPGPRAISPGVESCRFATDDRRKRVGRNRAPVWSVGVVSAGEIGIAGADCVALYIGLGASPDRVSADAVVPALPRV